MTPTAYAGKPSFTPPPATPKPGILQEVFNLDEGPVTLTFPASLSAESYQDLSDYLSLLLRKAKRNADAIRQFDEMIGKTGDE
jgi:hypothetical protein